MAWASKKQYAILMSSEEGKDLAEQLGEMEQDEFNKKFSELLGKSGESTSEAKENSNDDNEEEAKKKWLEENGYESEDEVPWWERDDNSDEYDDNDEEQPKEETRNKSKIEQAVNERAKNYKITEKSNDPYFSKKYSELTPEEKEDDFKRTAKNTLNVADEINNQMKEEKPYQEYNFSSQEEYQSKMDELYNKEEENKDKFYDGLSDVYKARMNYKNAYEKLANLENIDTDEEFEQFTKLQQESYKARINYIETYIKNMQYADESERLSSERANLEREAKKKGFNIRRN